MDKDSLARCILASGYGDVKFDFIRGVQGLSSGFAINSVGFDILTGLKADDSKSVNEKRSPYF
jgi:hypothetical protein